MSANHGVPPGLSCPAGDERALCERLERGEVLHYPSAPFPVPTGDDLDFLLRQELGALAHKNISYNPCTGRVAGFSRQGPEQESRLGQIFAGFSEAVTSWMGRTFSRYAQGWELDRCSYRPQEEATRRLRLTARNDLLHVDAFPGRPSHGRRILRAFVNINPREPRIWATSDPFRRLLERYGKQAGLPSQGGGVLRQLGRGLLRLLHPKLAGRSDYDAFMLRFHDFLKANEELQDRAPKRLWTFNPGAFWLAMTDTCSHAVLRGRYAIEHSYFVPPEVLFLPAESPPALLAAICSGAQTRFPKQAAA